MKYDVFISHASQDKNAVARPLSDALKTMGLSVWLDEEQLKIGDSIRRGIDQALVEAKFGVVIISPSYLASEWTKKELDALFSQESVQKSTLLPIYHNISYNDMKAFSPMLADKIALNSSLGIDSLAEEIRKKIHEKKDKQQHSKKKKPLGCNIQFSVAISLIVLLGLFIIINNHRSITPEGIKNNDFTENPSILNKNAYINENQCCSPARSDYKKGEIIVFSTNEKSHEIEKITKDYNTSIINKTNLASLNGSLYTIDTLGKEAQEIIDKISNRSLLNGISVSLNNIYYTSSAGSRNKKRGAYPLNMTGVYELKQLTKGKAVKIGMIDTPVDIHNPLINSDKVQRIELMHSGDHRNMQHGTAIASILTAPNTRIGIAPEAELIAIAAFHTSKPGVHLSTTSIIAKALEQAIHEKVDVLNLSFTGHSDPLLTKLINKAIEQGMIIVAPVGNGGAKSSIGFPASMKNVLAVTAVNNQSKIFSKASRGETVDIAAPGVSILTAAPGGNFSISSGTSLATAHVSGVIALMLSLDRNFKPKVLKETATDLGSEGFDTTYGYGLIDTKRALQVLQQ